VQSIASQHPLEEPRPKRGPGSRPWEGEAPAEPLTSRMYRKLYSAKVKFTNSASQANKAQVHER